MKITRLERITLAVTAVVLCAVLGYFLVGQTPQPLDLILMEESSPGGGENSLSVDLNTATEEELILLPGIGPVRAEAILAYREEHGPFQSVEELLCVNGIGEGVLAKIMPFVTVCGGGMEDG